MLIPPSQLETSKSHAATVNESLADCLGGFSESSCISENVVDHIRAIYVLVTKPNHNRLSYDNHIRLLRLDSLSISWNDFNKIIGTECWSYSKMFSLNSLSSVTKKYLSLKGFEPATSCVRDQDATTAPARQR